MANKKNIPIGLWKKYRIVISGGLSNEHFVKAPNKTIARSMAKGELNPWIKIIRIEEVSAWKIICSIRKQSQYCTDGS